MHTDDLNSAGEFAITFPCGGDTLPGIVHPGSTSSSIAIIMIVGGPQYRIGSHRQFVTFARAFANRGYPVLRFDHRGVGDCGGSHRHFYELDDDIRSSIDAIYHLYPSLQGVVLLGLCDSASAAMIYGSKDPRVVGLMLINPWIRTSTLYATVSLRHYYRRRFLQKSLWKNLLSRKINVASAMHEFVQVLRTAFDKSTSGDETNDFIELMYTGLSQFSGKVHLILSGADLTAKEFLSLCRSSHEWSKLVRREGVLLETLEGANHTISKESHRTKVTNLMLHWLSGITVDDVIQIEKLST